MLPVNRASVVSLQLAGLSVSGVHMVAYGVELYRFDGLTDYPKTDTPKAEIRNLRTR